MVDLYDLDHIITKKLRVSIFVDNGLNQSVTVQVMANRQSSTTKAVNVGSSFTVGANSSDSRTLTLDTSGWLPYIYVTVTCSTAPSSGSLTVYLVRSSADQPYLVNALAIRDTNTHTPDTDPSQVLIQEW
jgi:hypothetical protein